ncbi:putative fimbriae; chaperone [Klebsiella pneumoniae]|nr:putative fimbriae; chaperone [Klebsiella pneumoniae]
MSRFQWRSIFLFVFALSASFSALASVVMTGSRVIYPSNEKSVDVQLRNNDEFPYVIQAWFDSGDQNSKPTTGKAPFVVTPPTFRIAAKDGQVLRIFFTGEKALPNDRESIFYFNFLQVPPSNIGGDKGNQMVIMLKNRLKVFYRPAGLKSNNKKIFDYLSFSNITANNIRITNASPFYISLSKVAVKGVNAKDKPPMIAPFAAADVALNAGKVTDKNVQGIKIGLVNDYGATVTHEYPIQK